MKTLLKTDIVRFELQDVSLTNYGVESIIQKVKEQDNLNIDYLGFEENSFEYILHTVETTEDLFIDYIVRNFKALLKEYGINNVKWDYYVMASDEL
jgi:hypothetical protein